MNELRLFFIIFPQNMMCFVNKSLNFLFEILKKPYIQNIAEKEIKKKLAKTILGQGQN